mgnify:CR=1 FL=1
MERWDTLWDGGWTFCFDDSAFMPSTDSFLLGSFPPLRQGWRVCDLGAGTGLLGLLLLAREPALTVTGLELSPDACELAAQTAAANGLTDRLVTLPCDLRERSQLPAAGSFDLAVSNPPYFPAGGGRTAAGSRGTARSELTCTMEQLCAAASYLLRSGGVRDLRWVMEHTAIDGDAAPVQTGAENAAVRPKKRHIRAVAGAAGLPEGWPHRSDGAAAAAAAKRRRHGGRGAAAHLFQR